MLPNLISLTGSFAFLKEGCFFSKAAQTIAWGDARRKGYQLTTGARPRLAEKVADILALICVSARRAQTWNGRTQAAP